MIDGKTVLALIPARGGSKGIPGKNLAMCGGKPLIQWTIEAARRSRYVDFIVVSTDSDEIAAVVKKPVELVKRPAELATDDAVMSDVVLHVFSKWASKFCVLLQPTSPLRTTEDIDGAIEVLKGCDSIVSVCEVQKHPYRMHSMQPEGTLRPLFHGPECNRQDLPKIYQETGAIYGFDVVTFQKSKRFIGESTIGYVMPAERSVDVDYPLDLALASMMIATSGSCGPASSQR